MTESEARAATLLEAFETAQPASASWGEEDRRWADRVAAEAVPAGAGSAAFVAGRARHALQRLLPREPGAARWLARSSHDGRRMLVVGVLGVALGLLVDGLAGGRRINLLAPPFWGVLLWNVGVYAVMLALAVRAVARRRRPEAGPLQRGLQALLGVVPALPVARRAAAPSAAALAGLGRLWPPRSAGLAMARAQALLHFGAAAIGLGLIAGLYVRGLALDYRVFWESTFLSPPVVHTVLSALLAPASALTGIALPDAAGFAALQAGPGGRGEGAPAAAWIHLLALTMALVVIAPRLLLALLDATLAAHRRSHFALSLDAPYFQRLARLHKGGTAEVEVRPYAHTPSPQATLGLQALLGEAFGPHTALRVAPTAAFGAEDDAAPLVLAPASLSHALLVFDLAATPEAESHGRFARRLGAHLPSGAVLAILVDEAGFRRRFAGMEDRLEQRRAAWTAFAAGIGSVPVFVDLEAPVDAGAVEALHAAFARPVDPAAGPPAEPRAEPR